MPIKSSSVLITLPVYNAAKTIRNTLDSLLNQTFENFQLYISLDHSEDNTLEILSDYSDKRIVLHRRQPPRGLFYNFNSCIDFARKNSHYDFFCIYNSDDLYAPTMLEEQVRAFELHPHVSMVFTEAFFIDPSNRVIGSSHNVDTSNDTHIYNFSQMFIGSLDQTITCMSPSFMMRTSCLFNPVLVANPEKYGQAADFGLYLEIAKNHGPAFVIPKKLLSYRISNTNSSNQIFNGIPDNNKLIDIFMEDSLIKPRLKPKDHDHRMIHRLRYEIKKANFLIQDTTPTPYFEFTAIYFHDPLIIFYSLGNLRTFLEHLFVRSIYNDRKIARLYYRSRSLLSTYFAPLYRRFVIFFH